MVDCAVLEEELEWVLDEGSAGLSALADAGGASLGEALDALLSPATWAGVSQWLSVASGDSRFQLAGLLAAAAVLWAAATLASASLYLASASLQKLKRSWRQARGEAAVSDVPTMDLVSEALKDLRRKKDAEPLPPPPRRRRPRRWLLKKRWFTTYFDDLNPMAHTENVVFELSVLAVGLIFVFFWVFNDDSFLIP
mmetsp:Transcript_16233/g.41481  ORF Transcript_16233/g.41481 Transcript_16233/m.41481 type:complete len:196 (+) Transcript_16233:549-1136(+)